jgi:hypothetical protein
VNTPRRMGAPVSECVTDTMANPAP